MANYASGSGTATLAFSYVVAAGQNAADLDYASTTALALNGGSIQDAAGNAAVLTLPATGTDGLATKKIVIDTTPPAVTAVSSTQAAGAYTAGTTIPITVTFSEMVTVTRHAATDAQRRRRWPITPAAAARRRSSSATWSRRARTRRTWTMPRPPPWRSMAAPSRTLAGNAAVLTLPATGTDGLATQNIVIDTTPPSGYTVTPNYSVYGLSNSNIAGFTIRERRDQRHL